MSPVTITINISLSPEGVETVDVRQGEALLNESQAPAPVELDQLEAALETKAVGTTAIVPSDTEAGLGPGESVMHVAEEAPSPAPLDELEDLSDSD